MGEVRGEFLLIDDHEGAVTDASFAPDGTALATSSKDGTVKFFQV
jgi:WD40 repeat protein